jgi:S-formylglutathione hydrolase
VSAFAPISSPLRCPWGEKALACYLGENREDWRRYDATELLAGAEHQLPILVDQGTEDPFLEEQLKPGLLEEAGRRHAYPLDIRYQPGYDHSYFFIATFIDQHLDFHARYLGIAP